MIPSKQSNLEITFHNYSWPIQLLLFLLFSLVDKSNLLPPWFPSFTTACLGGLLFGLDIGSSSSVLRILGTGLSEFGSLDPIQLGQIASSSLFGAMISSGLIIFIGDKVIGRKNELQIG